MNNFNNMHHKFNSCKDHWIYFIIHPRDGKISVQNSIDYDHSTYAAFMTILER